MPDIGAPAPSLAVQPPVEAVSRMRWVMIGLAFFATVINYLDRQALSVVAPMIREQFGMSNVDYSRVVFAFMLAYTIANGVSGPLIDRLGTRIGYALSMLWWSVASLLHAFATGPISLGFFRLLLGFGEAGNWPAGVRVVAEWFPVRERALASGIFNSGAAIGAILAPPVVVWIVLRHGWPAAFVAVSLTGFVWLAVWWFVYYTPASAAPRATQARVSPYRLLRTRWLWVFMLSKMFMDPVWYFYIFWFPQYLRSARGFDMASIGMFAWIPFVTADIGNLLGGLLSGLLLKMGASVNLARKGAVTFFACIMTSAIPAVLVENPYASIALVSVATLGYTGTVANMLAIPADVFPKTVVGSIWGLAGLGTGFGGMLFSLATGWAIDHYSYVPVFFVYGVMPVLSAAVLWLWLGRIQPGAAGIPVDDLEEVR